MTGEPIFTLTKAHGRDLLICVLPSWPQPVTGSARVPPNGDMDEARRRARERAERNYVERAK